MIDSSLVCLTVEFGGHRAVHVLHIDEVDAVAVEQLRSGHIVHVEAVRFLSEKAEGTIALDHVRRVGDAAMDAALERER